jgi:GTP-binding protein
MLPIIAIVGRPNVGKSTLFNRMIGKSKAITSSIPHTTRDRLYDVCEWDGVFFVLVDTGGFTMKKEEPLQEEVNLELKKTLEGANKILFVVDGKTPITSDDLDLAQMLRNSGKKVILVVNKVDNYTKKDEVLTEFFSLGFEEVVPISAQHGINTDELLDRIIEGLPTYNIEKTDHVKVTLVGNVNVGKSSIFNKLLGRDRAIVDVTAGTTRDIIEEELILNREKIIIADTAGIRRKWREGSIIEKLAVSNTLRMINRTDLVLLILDIKDGLTGFDKRIIHSILEMEKPIIVVWNKLDLVEKNFYFPDTFPLISYAPVCYTSCTTGKGFKKLKETIISVIEAGRRVIGKGELDRALAGLTFPGEDGKMIKVYYGKQVDTSPPKFLLFVSNAKAINSRTIQELTKKIRGVYPYRGNPIKLEWRES